MRRSPSTISDVARTAGVSAATVSKVLNDDPSISDSTARRVRDAVRTLGYQRVRAVSRRVQPGTIGVILPELVNPFFSGLLEGILDAARVHDYACIVVSAGSRQEAEYAGIQMLRERGAQGIVFIPSLSKNPRVAELVDDTFPLVLLDRTLEGGSRSSVTSDGTEGAYQAAKYLLKLGHRRILYMGGPRNVSTDEGRFRGFRMAMEEAGLAVDPAMIVEAEFDQNEARAKMRQLLEARSSFTAVFATNDMMAFGVKMALEEAGLRVPQDVSLVGYDDIPFAASIGLTTVSQPAREMGKNALLLLLDIIHGRITAPESIVLRPSMVIRGSCMMNEASAGERTTA